MNVVILVFAGFLLCLLITGVGIFLFFLLKAVMDLRKTVESATALMASLVELTKEPSMRVLPQTLGMMAQGVPALLDGVSRLVKLLGIFNDIVLRSADGGKGSVPAATASSSPEQSTFTSYSDADAAEIESRRILRQTGHGVQEEPTRHSMFFTGSAPPPPPFVEGEASSSEPVEVK